MENSRHALGRDKLLYRAEFSVRSLLWFKAWLPSSFPFGVAGKTVQVNNSTAYFAGFLYTLLSSTPSQSLTISSHGLAMCSVSATPEVTFTVKKRMPPQLQEASLALHQHGAHVKPASLPLTCWSTRVNTDTTAQPSSATRFAVALNLEDSFMHSDLPGAWKWCWLSPGDSSRVEQRVLRVWLPAI